jgi:hypothetical protein
VDGVITHFVDGPGVPIEQHLHALEDGRLGLVPRQRSLPAVDELPEQGLSNVAAIASRNGRRSVGRALQVDVGQEAAQSSGLDAQLAMGSLRFAILEASDQDGVP